MKKLFKITIKFTPILQMMMVLLNNILYYFDVYDIYLINNYLFANSFILTFILFVISFTFGYCNWYRLIVTGNYINSTIGFICDLNDLNDNDVIMLLTYSSITLLFIILAIISKFNCHGAKR